MQSEHFNVGRSLIFSRGICCRCPNCGLKGIMKDWFHLRYRCLGCGMVLQRREGDSLGAATLNYGIVVFLFLPVCLLSGGLGWLSWNSVIYLCLALSVISPVVLYPLSWSLWMMTYYLILPHELPANQCQDVVDEGK